MNKLKQKGKVINKHKTIHINEPFYLRGYYPYLWIFIAIFLLFIQVIGFDYTYLDDNALLLNYFPFLKKLSYIKQAFCENVFHLSSGKGMYYRPLLTLSFMFDTMISGGGKIGFFHFMNIFYHLIATCLLFKLFMVMDFEKIKAFFFSMLFAVHPMAVQVVAWIPGRNDSIMAIFILSSFIYMIRYNQHRKLKFLFLSLLLFICSLFTKENSIFLLPVFILYFRIKQKSSMKKLILPFVLMGLFIMIWLNIRYHALSFDKSIVADYTVKATIMSFFENTPALLTYIGKFFIPLFLSVYPVLKDMSISIITGCVALIFFVVMFFYTKFSHSAMMFFGISWFLLFISLTIVTPTTDFPVFSEHRSYLAMVGLLLFIMESRFVIIFFKRGKWAIYIYSGIIIIFAIFSFIHSHNFKDKMTFWQSAVKTSPSNSFNNNNLGAMYYLNKDLQQAEKYFRKAVSLNPKEPLANGNIGMICMNTGRPAEAENYYLLEMQYNPLNYLAYSNCGILYAKNNNLEEAAKMWERSIDLSPYDTETYHNLLVIYRQLGKNADIDRILNKALQYNISIP